jgi:hypothetical protein
MLIIILLLIIDAVVGLLVELNSISLSILTKILLRLLNITKSIVEFKNNILPNSKEGQML